MESDPQQQISTNTPLYKEVLVAVLVGGRLGPIIGWFIKTFATFFAAAAMDTSNIHRSLDGKSSVPLTEWWKMDET